MIKKIEAIPARIKQDEAYLGSLPEGARANNYFLRPPYRCLYSEYFETCFVKITTDDGLVGWGEALAPVAPEVAATIIEQLLSPALLRQDPLSADMLWHKMYNLMRERGYYGGFMLDAISACDTALWDLRGKILEQPVYKLLGGAYRDKVPCYVSGLPKPSKEERAELAQSWAEKDFWNFKLAAGHGVNEDAQSVASLREALGDKASLLLDVHWVYSLNEAIQLGQKLEPYDVAILEAPMNPEDIAGHAKLSEAISMKVAIGETERTRFQFLPWLEQRAASLLQPDVGRAGISETLKIAHMAEAFNIQIAPHLSVQQGICTAASIHVAAAIPNLWLLEFQVAGFELGNRFLDTPLICKQGHFQLPEGIGLGVEINEQAIADLQA